MTDMHCTSCRETVEAILSVENTYVRPTVYAPEDGESGLELEVEVEASLSCPECGDTLIEFTWYECTDVKKEDIKS